MTLNVNSLLTRSREFSEPEQGISLNTLSAGHNHTRAVVAGIDPGDGRVFENAANG
jgi:hypothetical protein